MRWISFTTQFTTAFLKGTAPQQKRASSKLWKLESIRTIILQEGMIAAMKEVGRRFEEGDYFVPEMLIAARAMQSGLVVLKPYLVDADIKPAGKVAVGTVKGDLHDIGKNLVAMMLEGAGFVIYDLGTDVAPETFVSRHRGKRS